MKMVEKKKPYNLDIINSKVCENWCMAFNRFVCSVDNKSLFDEREIPKGCLYRDIQIEANKSKYRYQICLKCLLEKIPKEGSTASEEFFISRVKREIEQIRLAIYQQNSWINLVDEFPRNKLCEGCAYKFEHTVLS